MCVDGTFDAEADDFGASVVGGVVVGASVVGGSVTGGVIVASRALPASPGSGSAESSAPRTTKLSLGCSGITISTSGTSEVGTLNNSDLTCNTALIASASEGEKLLDCTCEKAIAALNDIFDN